MFETVCPIFHNIRGVNFLNLWFGQFFHNFAFKSKTRTIFLGFEDYWTIFALKHYQIQEKWNIKGSLDFKL